MTSPLNGPLEVGVRVVMLLAETFPTAVDLNRLVILDHALLHSADLGGPPSLHPDVPIRAGELGVKRRVLSDGLELMTRAGLVEVVVTQGGIGFKAQDRARGFVDVLASGYAGDLQSRAGWAISTLGSLDDEALRTEARRIFDAWSEEFDPIANEAG